MLAEFYILESSFENNTNYVTHEVEERIKSLANDFVYIRNYSQTNKIYIHPETYNVNFLKGVLLSDILYDPQIANVHLDRDVFNSLQTIIIESATTTISAQEVIEVLLPEHNESICHGLIAFNTVSNIQPEFQIVYNVDGWLQFRRHFLGLYPQNIDFFIDECNKYFPNLYFHDRNRVSIKSIFKDCPKKIIFHLSALNDKLNSIDKTDKNRSQVLQAFSITAKLDETASLEGNAASKENFTFQFVNDNEELEDVCCEPHLKLCYSDSDETYSTERRVYFHEGVKNVQGGKILIGHIGSHL